MNLSWLTAFEADVQKAYTWGSGEEQKMVSLVEKLGSTCGSNTICQQLANAALNEGVHIENEVVTGWLANKSWGKWCSGNSACMSVVHEGLADATTAEKTAVAHWLHPTAMILMI